MLTQLNTLSFAIKQKPVIINTSISKMFNQKPAVSFLNLFFQIK